MKLLFTVLAVVGVFFLTGGDHLLTGTMNAMTAEAAHSQADIEGQPLDVWIQQVKAAFDPSWVENLKNADLATTLKAVSGNSPK